MQEENPSCTSISITRWCVYVETAGGKSSLSDSPTEYWINISYWITCNSGYGIILLERAKPLLKKSAITNIYWYILHLRITIIFRFPIPSNQIDRISRSDSFKTISAFVVGNTYEQIVNVWLSFTILWGCIMIVVTITTSSVPALALSDFAQSPGGQQARAK